MTAPSNSVQETRLSIPFPSRSDPQIHLIGILAHHAPLQATPASSSSTASSVTRPLALITHGVLSHKNQSYHRLLAQTLPIDSFRFDFRGNDESPLMPGQEWDMAGFGEDVKDMDAVVDFLSQEYGYSIDLVVGHSRGSLVGWKWFADRFGPESSTSQESQRSPPLWISLGGRWRMDRIHDRDEVWRPQFEEKGFHEWKVKVAGKPTTVLVRPTAVTAFAEYPVPTYVERFPSDVPCLLIHGTADETVPCADVGYYLNSLGGQPSRLKQTGWQQIHLVENGDHMLRGHYEEVVDVITRWYRSHRDGGAGEGSRDASVSGGGGQMALEAKQEGDVLERSWKESVGGGGNSSGSKL